MDKGERLTQFLQWMETRGSVSMSATELRGVAEALLDESGGGRVTESHILAVGDRFARTGGDSATTMVTEGGELFLRFEEAQRLAGTPSAAPRGPMGTLPPRRTNLGTTTGSSAALASAPLDVAGPLRPPERLVTGSDALPPSPVTFVRTSQQVTQPIEPLPPLAPPLPLPLPSPRETQPLASGVRQSQPLAPGLRDSQRLPAAPGPRESQRLAALPGPRESQRLIVGPANAFRCPRCAVMVVPGPDERCPRCGAPAPHLVDMPSASAPVPEPHASSQQASRPFNWPALLAVVLAGTIGSVAGIKWSRTACDQNRGASVAGEASVGRLGVKVYFPSGWRKHKGVDQVQPLMPGVTAKMLGYYRGGTSENPEVGMMLMTTGDLPLAEDQSIIGDAEFKELLDNAADGMSKSGKFELAPCEVIQLGLRRTGRCTGEGTSDGQTRRVALYAWTMDRRLGIAMFFARGGLPDLVTEADDIVGGIESLAPAVAQPEPSVFAEPDAAPAP